MKLLLISFFVMGMLISPSFAAPAEPVEIRLDESFDKSSYNIGDAGVVQIAISSSEELEINWVSITLFFTKNDGSIIERLYRKDYEEEEFFAPGDSTVTLNLEFQIFADPGIISGPLRYRITLSYSPTRLRDERFITYYSLKQSSSTVTNPALPSYISLEDEISTLEDDLASLQQDYEDLQTNYSDLDSRLSFVTNLLYISSAIAVLLVIITAYLLLRRRTE